MVLVRRIPAPISRVRAAAGEPIRTGFADPVEARGDDEGVVWDSVPDVVEGVRRSARMREDGGGTVLTLEARYRVAIPYFAWFFAPLVALSIRRGLGHMADVITAHATGAEPPPAPARPFWAPPDRASHEQVRSIATICAVLAVAGYAGGLFTQTLDFVADGYRASTADLGVALAVTRVGTVIGFVGAALADRRGRRVMLVVSVIGLSIASGLSSLAPNLATLTAAQLFARGFSNLAVVVGFVALTEEAPERARAYTLAIAGVAGGAGFAIGAGLLPLADLGREAWRALFAVGSLGLFLVPGIARRLTETRRYAAVAMRTERASARELTDRFYGGRLATVAATTFLMALFATPAFQFTNRYLSDERGYSGLGILVLRFFTQGFPALIGVWIGGRLAETVGRKPVAVWSTVVTALATAAFFLSGDGALWLAMLVATVSGAVGGPSLSAFGTELFPTAVRGRAGAWLLAAGVAGSAIGLVLVGSLRDPFASVGRAVAVTTVAPIAVALFLIPRLPEGRGRALDDLSPPDA